MEIRFVDFKDIVYLRRDAIRPGQPLANVTFPEDELPTTFHLGVVEDGQIVASITFLPQVNPDFDDEKQYRMRSLCTNERYRNRGYASALVRRGFEEVARRGGKFVWFTARVHLLEFYHGFGCKEYGDEFLIPNSCMHKKMYVRL